VNSEKIIELILIRLLAFLQEKTSTYISIVILLIISLNNTIAVNNDKSFRRIGIEDGLAPGNVNDIIQDSLGFIWLGTESGLCRYDGYNFKIFQNKLNDSTSLSFNNVFSLQKDDNRIIWVGTLGGGLNKFDSRNEKFTQFKFDTNDDSSISSNIIFKVYRDSKNRLWITTLGGGLNLYNEANNSFTRFVHRPKDFRSISSNMVSAIFEDSKGNLWVGTFDEGLHMFDYEKNIFHQFKVDPSNEYSLNHNQIMDIIEYSPDSLLIATFGGGINVFNTETGKISHYKNERNFNFDTEHKNVRKLFDDGQHIWIGSYNGLYRYSKDVSTMGKYISDQNNDQSLNNNKIASCANS
jgi:ligand-binding sensor domain-containing protein